MDVSTLSVATSGEVPPANISIESFDMIDLRSSHRPLITGPVFDEELLTVMSCPANSPCCDGRGGGCPGAPVYSLGPTQPSVHAVSSIAQVLSGSGKANDEAKEPMLTPGSNGHSPSTHKHSLYPV